MAARGCPCPLAGGSGVALPRRRTFTPALRASAHCMSAALRHPWLRLLPQPGDMVGPPPPQSVTAKEYGKGTGTFTYPNHGGDGPGDGSRLPTPARRTFAAGLQPFAHSMLTALRPSWAALASNAGSLGMGNLSRMPLWQCRIDFVRLSHRWLRCLSTRGTLGVPRGRRSRKRPGMAFSA